MLPTTHLSEGSFVHLCVNVSHRSLGNLEFVFSTHKIADDDFSCVKTNLEKSILEHTIYKKKIKETSCLP